MERKLRADGQEPDRRRCRAGRAGMKPRSARDQGEAAQALHEPHPYVAPCEPACFGFSFSGSTSRSERSTFWLSHLSAIEAEGHHPEGVRRARGTVAAGALSVAQAPGGRRSSQPRQAWRICPGPDRTFDDGPPGCTVVIDAQLPLECAMLPGVDWLAALNQETPGSGLSFAHPVLFGAFVM